MKSHRKNKPKIIFLTGGLCLLLALTGFAACAITRHCNSGQAIVPMHSPAGSIIQPDRENFTFSVMGDLVVNTAVFSGVWEKSEKDNPALVLLLGDIVPRHNQEIFNCSSLALSRIIKNRMVAKVPGNHDVADCAKGKSNGGVNPILIIHGTTGQYSA